MSELLKIDEIHTYYGNIHALQGVSLTVHEGEIVTLIGSNGAGKTTTINTISGILKPKEGDCCVFCSYGSVKCPPIQSEKKCC